MSGTQSPSGDCFICNKKLQDGMKIIQCDTCMQWIHLKCAKLSKALSNILQTTGEVEWDCTVCVTKKKAETIMLNTQTESVDIEHLSMEEQIKYIATKVSKIDSIEASVQFYSDQYVKLDESVTAVKKDIKDLKSGADMMTGDIKSLKSAMKTLNDERVKNEIVIRK